MRLQELLDLKTRDDSTVELPSIDLRIVKGDPCSLSKHHQNHNIWKYFERMNWILENMPDFNFVFTCFEIESKLASGKIVELCGHEVTPEEAGYFAQHLQNPQKYPVHGYRKHTSDL